MITFANPAWLYGLLGLVIPIGIHLLSRKEGKTIYIGSVRHLTDSDTAQFSSIRLNEIVLLILRLLLLTLLVFILAGFHLEFNNGENKQWLVIEKGVEKNREYKGLIDSLKAKGFELHWLTNELPKYEDSSRVVGPSNYYKLITQIQSNVDTAIVMSYNYANRFKGERTALPITIKWLHVEPDEKLIAVQATTLNGDSIIARISNSSSQGVSFQYSRFVNSDFEKVAKIDSLRANPPDTVSIAIFADPEFDYDRKIVQAALQAIGNGLPQKFKTSVSNTLSDISTKADVGFWLSEKPCQLKEGLVVGYVNCAASKLPLLISREKSELYCNTNESLDWILSKRLNEENALEESLTFSLAKILLNELPIYRNENISAADQRSIATQVAFEGESKSSHLLNSVDESRSGSEPLVLILLFLVLIAERYLAYKRNQ